MLTEENGYKAFVASHYYYPLILASSFFTNYKRTVSFNILLMSRVKSQMVILRNGT